MAKKDTDVGAFDALAAMEKALDIDNEYTGHRPQVIPTGFHTLDHDILQIGGIPRRRFTQIFGKPKNGKSNLILRLIRQEQRINPTKVPVLLDTEYTFDAEWARYNGVDTSRLMVIQDNVAERAFEKTRKLINTGHTGLVAVDSLGHALEERAFEYDIKTKDRQTRKPGDFAKACGEWSRLVTGPIHDHDVAVVIVNQIREKFGGYGASTDTPGGWNIKHSLSMNLEVTRVNYLRVDPSNKESDAIGMTIAAKLIASKVGAERKTNDKNHIKLYFGDPQISAAYELYDRALYAQVFAAKGAWVSFMVGDEIKERWNGRKLCLDALQTDAKLFAQVERRVNIAEGNHGANQRLSNEATEELGSDVVSAEEED